MPRRRPRRSSRPRWWRGSATCRGCGTTHRARGALAEALFERVEVLGLRRMRIEPTPSAVAAGLVEAFSRASAGHGRGERSSADTIQLSVRIVGGDVAAYLGRTTENAWRSSAAVST
jgi:hypothetical protein